MDTDYYSKDKDIEGQEVDYLDRMSIPDIKETDWKHKVIFDKETNEPLIRLSDVESLMIENEELRESLHLKLSTFSNRYLSLIDMAAGHSTSDVLKAIKRIETVTQKKIKGRDVFNFIYSLMHKQFGINFKYCPSTKTKLQWLWEGGYLPVVSFLVFLLENLLSEQRKISRAKTYELYKDIATKLSTQTPISKKDMNNLPF